jgi:hypothetical protein
LVNGATTTDCTHHWQSTPAETVTHPGVCACKCFEFSSGSHMIRVDDAGVIQWQNAAFPRLTSRVRIPSPALFSMSPPDRGFRCISLSITRVNDVSFRPFAVLNRTLERPGQCLPLPDCRRCSVGHGSPPVGCNRPDFIVTSSAVFPEARLLGNVNWAALGICTYAGTASISRTNLYRRVPQLMGHQRPGGIENTDERSDK